jgi:ABC-type multidrug transport system fused ATPase/permease subunit
VRFNLDPFNRYTDTEIWEALRDAHIDQVIEGDPAGLDAKVEESGKNLSSGQRQLISMARAILRKCSVVLMDEVTANCDFKTDKLIQATIRTSNSLKHATIITVAHRIRTLADSDLIIAIDSGRVVEQGRPLDLLNQPTSYFKSLAEESNEFEDIYSIATTASKPNGDL